MEFERIWRNIRIVSAWVQGSCPPKNGREPEILKPLNKLIDFDLQECIHENGFRL